METKQYDADGRLIADVYTYAPGTIIHYTGADFPNNSGKLYIGGWLSGATTYYYGADGELTASFSYSRVNADQNYWNNLARQLDNGADPAAQSAIPPTLRSLQDAANGAGYGVLGHQSHVTHWDPATGTGGYDREDNALAYGYSAINGLGQWHTTTYKVSYLRQDGYLEQATRGTSDDPSVLATTATSLYDAFGRRIAIDTVSSGQSTHQVRAFAFDAEGEILERRDGSATGSSFTVTANGGYATQHYAYVGGRAIGSVDEHGSIDVLSGVTGFSNSSQGTSSYVVQAGDTLQSIAQAVYGDASLWYVVAGANGLTGDGDLAAGQSLKLPQVTTHSNTAETFKPYNPREIAGSTTPALPQAPMPAPSNHHCNTVAAIIVIAVVVVASIYTAGAVAAAYGGAVDSVAIGTTSVATGSTFATGAGVLAGGGAAVGIGTGEGLIAAAAGGFVGNAAGQLAGDALGVHQGFSLGEAIAGGLTSAATAGIGGAIGRSSALLNAGGGLNTAGYALQGAADYAAGMTANKLVGQPQQFSWANLVAASVGSAVTGKLGLPTNHQLQDGMGTGNFFGDLGGSLLNGALDSETARLLGGNAANGRRIVEDAFGNALGNAAIREIQDANTRRAIKELQDGLQALAKSRELNDSALPASPVESSHGMPLSQPIQPPLYADRVAPLLGNDWQFAADATGPYGLPTWLIAPNLDDLYVGPGLVSRSSPQQQFWDGSRQVVADLLSSGVDPAKIGYPGAPQDFDPLAPPHVYLGRNVDNDAVNALIAKSTTLTAALNYLMQVGGYSLQLVSPGGQTDLPTRASFGDIEIPAAYADNPAAIVSTLAHEVGHALWGDTTIAYYRNITKDMSEVVFVDKQVAARLESEGIATLMNIAAARQIWGTDIGHVNGAVPGDISQRIFDDAFDAIVANGSRLSDEAAIIGSYYGSQRQPFKDPSVFYKEYYSTPARAQYQYYNQLDQHYMQVEFDKAHTKGKQR